MLRSVNLLQAGECNFLIFTQPGAHLLEIPCTLQTFPRKVTTCHLEVFFNIHLCTGAGGLIQKQTMVLIGCVGMTVTRGEGVHKSQKFCERPLKLTRRRFAASGASWRCGIGGRRCCRSPRTSRGRRRRSAPSELQRERIRIGSEWTVHFIVRRGAMWAEGA